MTEDELKEEARKQGLSVSKKKGPSTKVGTPDEKTPRFVRLYKRDVDYCENNDLLGCRSLSQVIRTAFNHLIEKHKRDNNGY